jgi:hypothetical protein
MKRVTDIRRNTKRHDVESVNAHNNRKLIDGERALEALKGFEGKRLPCRD